MELRIATYNVNGITDPTKRRAVFEYLNTVQAEIILIQETHSKVVTEHHWQREWTRGQAFFHSSIKQQAESVVAILAQNKNIYMEKISSDLQGRILTAKVFKEQETFYVTNIYAPAGAQKRKQNYIFFESLYPYIQTNGPTILAGDFNCIENPTLDKYPPVKKYPTPSTLTELTTNLQLEDAFRKRYPKEKSYTRHAANSHSRLDRFYINNACIFKYQQILPSLFSDHDVVILSLTSSHKTPAKSHVWKNNTSLYKKGKYKTEIQIYLNKFAQEMSTTSLNPLEIWIKLKCRVKKLLNKLGKSEARIKTHNTIVESQRLFYLHKQMVDNPTEQTFQEYNNLRKALHKQFIETTRLTLLKSKADLEEYKNLPLATLYKQLSPHRERTTFTELENDQQKILTTHNEIRQEIYAFYKNLYETAHTDQNILTHFLTPLLPTLDSGQAQTIGQPITQQELLLSIKEAKKGKSPGLDGLSVEFYTTFFPEIKTLLLAALNFLYNNGIPNTEIAEGAITLIHKKGDRKKISNYRPITLLNTDYKILSKILNKRITPLLGQIISPLQNLQPSSSTHMASAILRDTYYEAQKNPIDSYFIAIDFKKAFDSIAHTWLIQVLTFLKFPQVFTKYIDSIQQYSTSKIQVNSTLTDPFFIRKGVRQGDPISPTLFIIALNPLLFKIQFETSISPVPNPIRNAPKIVAYADDVTLCISKKKSVLAAQNLFSQFHQISGLEINKNKSVGLTTSKKNNKLSTLWNINWEDTFIEPLNISIGPQKYITSLWNKKIKQLRDLANQLNHHYATYDMKAVISKTMLTPIITYLAHTYPLPEQKVEQINNIISTYIAGPHQTTLSVHVISQTRVNGGYNIADIPLYADLYYIKPLTPFLRFRLTNEILPQSLQPVEYNIGLQISNLFRIAKNNTTPHAASPSPYYKKQLRIVEKYKITYEELLKGNIKEIYQRIKSKNTHSKSKLDIYLKITSPNYTWLHHPVLPNYLKTFNYQLTKNVLPVRVKTQIDKRDSLPLCYFCKEALENDIHLFTKCPQIQPLLKYTTELYYRITTHRTTFFHETFRHQFHTPHPPTHCDEDLIPFLNSVLSHTIWKTRDKTITQVIPDISNYLIKSLKTSLKIRSRIYSQRHKKPFEKLLHSIVENL